ncbi:MAG: CoA-binding protein [Thermodesulfobacteriota bacterium]
MNRGEVIKDDGKLKAVLNNSKTIAVLGLSPKPERDSFRVAKYLQENGYQIIPVRPGQEQILGQASVSSLNDIHEPVDIIDVFRRSDQIMEHAREALRIKPKLFWMQLGVENMEAAELLIENGINVVMNRCIKIEHARLAGK